MARKAKGKKRQPVGQDLLTRRLALIKKRHRKLILETREMIAADLAADMDETMVEEFLEPNELELADAARR